MTDIRLNRAKKNIIVSLGCQLITILCGLIVPRVILGTFGSEVYGATTSITQFLSYIALLEGGVGGVARSVLYKPLADGDSRAISHIMAETKSFFRVVGYIFVGYVLVVACGFKQISGLICLDWITSFFLVFAISLSTFGQYFIGISNAVLLQAAQRSYITNTVNILATLLNAVAVCILVNFGIGIVAIKLISSLIFFLRPVALWLYIRLKFGLKSVTKSESKHLTQKWSGLGQHLAFYLHSNTDVVILTLFSDLYNVAVYAVYNMIISNIQNLVGSFVAGMEALFGDMLAKEEKEELHNAFNYYELLLSLVSVILLGTTLSLILPFITLYTENITDVNYILPALAVFLILSSLLYCLRMPYHSVVIAAGHFKQTQIAAYMEAAINILLSIVLVIKYGVPGVAFATMIATGFRFVYYVIYLSKKVIHRKITLFLRRFLINCIAFGVSVALGLVIGKLFVIKNYIDWVICACFCCLTITSSTIVINFIFCRAEFRNLFEKYTKKRKNHEKRK